MSHFDFFSYPSSLFFAGFVILALYAAYPPPRNKREVRSLPCPPKASWLWGHELEAWQRASGEFYTQYIDSYGPTYRIKGAFGHEDILVLADPGGLAYLCRNIYNYPHSAIFRPLIDRLLGRALLWVERESEHKRMRRLINPAFSVESVKAMSPAILDSASKLQMRLANEATNNDGSVIVNALDFLSSATLDVIGQVGFGHDFGQGQSLEAKMISQAWREQVSLGLERSGFIALMALRLFPFITSLPIKAIQAQGEIKIIVKAIGSKMVERKVQDLSGRPDLLSVLMQASAKEKSLISKDELLDHICTFVMAGHETTSASLSYTLWELAKNPERQKRLREEALAFSGNPTYDNFQTKLPYLDACCKEGLRLHPPSAHMERVAEAHDVIPLRFPVTRADGTVMTKLHVEKGQLIYVPSISVNRLSSVWGDGEAFRPERWLEPNKGLKDVKIEGWSNLFTFSDGPRNCVGYRLAVFEWKTLMFTLIRHFIFHDTGAQVISRFSSTLQPRVIGKESEGIQLPIRVTLA